MSPAGVAESLATSRPIGYHDRPAGTL